MFSQLVTGLWAADVLYFFRDKKLEMLINQNSDLQKLIQTMCLTEQNLERIWYTLAGLKMLEANFALQKDTWKLVANKARKAIKSICGFKGDIDQALGLMKLEMSPY